MTAAIPRHCIVGTLYNGSWPACAVTGHLYDRQHDYLRGEPSAVLFIQLPHFEKKEATALAYNSYFATPLQKTDVFDVFQTKWIYLLEP